MSTNTKKTCINLNLIVLVSASVFSFDLIELPPTQHIYRFSEYNSQSIFAKCL